MNTICFLICFRVGYKVILYSGNHFILFGAENIILGNNWI